MRARRFSIYPKQKNKDGGTRTVDRKEDAIIASALSKVVFKKGRVTVSPDVMLQASGLLPPRPADIKLLQKQVLPAPQQRKIAQEIFDIPFRFFEQADMLYEATRNSLFPAPENDENKSREASPDGMGTNSNEFTWAKVEEERVRGLEMANKLAGLEELAGEFTAEADALGKHSDLYWFLGLTY